jgi:TnpA family transposase
MSNLKLKFKSEKPPDEVFIAGIIALGCNIGVRRMSKIANGITYEQLNDLIQWYFTKENVDAASRIINETIDKLSLPSVYQKSINSHHTSSDGQKFNVSVPSLNSSYSYKYFGTGKGVAAYSFIDEFSRLYYNTVIDSSAREASYVIDGLINDGTVTSETHSTDSHGYTEIVFGISSGLGVQFSPRIKNLKQQLIYTFRSHSPKSYIERGFKITPTATTYINEDLIEKQWDNILRIFMTIKLKVTTASRIIKRLGAYSRQHELHKALKELGRVHKSVFILKYADDVELRQDTEKALNRIEQSHQFAKAIFFGGNQHLKYGSKEEQELAISCRHLIQNTIVLWNYMTLTKLLLESKEEPEKYKSILDIIKSASIMTWRHINIHGEYDFEYHNSRDFFKIEQLLGFDVS